MANRVVKLTVVNDFVRSFPRKIFSSSVLFKPQVVQVCANSCIGQHELLSAISYCQDTLHLPLAFELEHMPFRLIPQECLSDNCPKESKVSKEDFYVNKYGREKFNAIQGSVAKWAKEKGIPMYVVLGPAFDFPSHTDFCFLKWFPRPDGAINSRTSSCRQGLRNRRPKSTAPSPVPDLQGKPRRRQRHLASRCHSRHRCCRRGHDTGRGAIIYY
jgi:hypothetical protein